MGNAVMNGAGVGGRGEWRGLRRVCVDRKMENAICFGFAGGILKPTGIAFWRRLFCAFDIY